MIANTGHGELHLDSVHVFYKCAKLGKGLTLTQI